MMKTPAKNGPPTENQASDVSKQLTLVEDHQAAYDPALFFNRELSWLNFNRRVLHEAIDPRTPLLERVKFLSIFSSNLDEFCMKRIGGLHFQIDANVSTLTVDGKSPEAQVLLCSNEILKTWQEKEQTYELICRELKQHKIEICEFNSLSLKEQKVARDYYLSEVHPLTTPQTIDISHPFPFISNLSLNLFVKFKDPTKGVISYARVKVPTGAGIDRFVRIPGDDHVAPHRYIGLEDVMMNNLDILFPEMEILSCNIFCITRNAITAMDHSDATDLVEMIKAHLRDRKFAPIVQLQVDQKMSAAQRAILSQKLGMDETQCLFTKASLLRMSDLMELTSIAMPDLKYPEHQAVENYALREKGTIFEFIDAHGSILLQHPYERFESSVIRFVEEASRDPEVQAIKMTLYRTTTDTRIVDYLIEAARNGKQVAVVVELTARFDENANIEWANSLERAGIHVSYGIMGLKTHCKVILVVRRQNGVLRRYAHMGSGNYHVRNARMYSDVGLLTSDTDLTNDLGELFNYLTTGCAPMRAYRQLLIAPHQIKKELIAKIDREIEHAQNGAEAHIRLKTNALEDPDLTMALYKASQAGVRIELSVRDICRLKPGLKGLSDKISIVSIVGQFLEHERIYHFHNAGEDEYYIGSADLMTRNLEGRVETLVPVKSGKLQQRLSWTLTSQLTDRRCAWELSSTGEYSQRSSEGQENLTGCQVAAIAEADSRAKAAIRIAQRSRSKERTNG